MFLKMKVKYLKSIRLSKEDKMIPPRIRSVSALENFCLELINEIYFKKVKSVQTTVEWPNGEDIDPNDLYENSTNAI